MLVESITEYIGPPNYVHYWVWSKWWILKTQSNLFKRCIRKVFVLWSTPNHATIKYMGPLKKATVYHPHTLVPVAVLQKELELRQPLGRNLGQLDHYPCFGYYFMPKQPKLPMKWCNTHIFPRVLPDHRSNPSILTRWKKLKWIDGLMMVNQCISKLTRVNTVQWGMIQRFQH